MDKREFVPKFGQNRSGQANCWLQFRRRSKITLTCRYLQEQVEYNSCCIHNISSVSRTWFKVWYIYCCCMQCAALRLLTSWESSPHGPSVISWRSKPLWRPWQQEDTTLLSSARTQSRYFVVNGFCVWTKDNNNATNNAFS